MTRQDARANLLRRSPELAAEAQERFDATTEQQIAQQMREEAYDPHASVPPDALRTVPALLVREKLGLTQTEFAALLRVPLGTLRNWEQNRFSIDPAAQALLLVLYREPEASLRALRSAA